MQICHLNEVDSTNRYLLNLLASEACEEGFCVWADYQNAGRGQMGNSWESASGQNLTFSVVLYPSFLKITEQFLLSQIVSVALIETLNEWGEFKIKWPNDIYWNDKKVAGILIENNLCGDSLESAVIGIGLNVNQQTFVGGAPNPVSLKQITGIGPDREVLLQKILNRIYRIYLTLIHNGDEALRTAYMAGLYRRDGFHRYKDSTSQFLARIAEVRPDGEIVLETPDLERKGYYFKEVEFLLP